MSKIDDAYSAAMNEAGRASLPAMVHGIPAKGTDYLGTCQACFNQYVVKQATTGKNRGKLVVVLHGYERPGHGYIVGECPGRSEEPFEVAKDVTISFQNMLEKRIISMKEHLKRLESGEIEDLMIQVRDRSTQHSLSEPLKYKSVIIKRHGEYPLEWGTFKSHLDRAIRDQKFHIESAERHLRFIATMLAKWKYNPEALVGARKQIQIEKTTKKESLKAERQAKLEAAAQKRTDALTKIKNQIKAFLDQPQFVTHLKERERTYWHGSEISRYEYIEIYLKKAELEKGFDSLWTFRSVLHDLKEAVKRARSYGIKVKN